MAHEAILKVRTHDPLDFTVADGTGIEKGALCALTDPNTGILVSVPSQPIAGIAAREKVASDGRTQLAMFNKGVFEMTASGAITVGEPVSSAADSVATGFANTVEVAQAAAVSGAAVIGYALETATDLERILVKVDIGAGAPQGV